MSQVQKWLPKAEGKERRLKAIAVIQAGHTGGEKSFTVGVCVCVWWWGGGDERDDTQKQSNV